MPSTTASLAQTQPIPLQSHSQTRPNALAATLAPNSLAVSIASPSQQQATAISNGPNVPASGVVNSGQILPVHQRHWTWRDRLENACSVANGLGTLALIAAFIFGIGAWVGMNIQINQGGKGLELTIWATCADHEVRESQGSNNEGFRVES